MRPVVRFDRLEMRLDAQKTSEGYIRGTAIVGRSGIQLYSGPNGTTRRVLRHPDDVFSASHQASLRMIPMTLQHPDELVNADNCGRLGVGMTGQDVQIDGKHIELPFVIVRGDAVAAVEGGVQELSLGYTCEERPESGTWDGQAYDYRQYNHQGNHLAIVDRARAGASARINLDGDEILDQDENPQQGDQIMPVKVTLKGIQYDAAPEVAFELDSVSRERDGLKARVDSLKEITLDGGLKVLMDAQAAEALSKTQAERDAAKQDLKVLMDARKAEQDAAARKSVLAMAGKVLDAVTLATLKDASLVDLQRAVVVAAAPEANRKALGDALATKDAAYVQARFDAACETLPQGDKASFTLEDPPKSVTDQVDELNSQQASVDEARAGMTKKQQDAWQPKK